MTASRKARADRSQNPAYRPARVTFLRPPDSVRIHLTGWPHDAGRGFVVTGLGAHFGRTDSGEGDQWGDAGSRTFLPGYGFSNWYGEKGNKIDLHWGTWRSHSSSSFGGLSGPYDWCVSSYQIEVSVQGPLGVPFRPATIPVWTISSSTARSGRFFHN